MYLYVLQLSKALQYLHQEVNATVTVNTTVMFSAVFSSVPSCSKSVSIFAQTVPSVMSVFSPPSGVFFLYFLHLSITCLTPPVPHPPH